MNQVASRTDKILVVDDDARIRDLLRRYLAQEGFEVFQAEDGKTFLRDGWLLAKLIALHRNSDARPFQDEGVAIEKMVQRKLRFEADLAALQTSLPLRAWHVALHGDREMTDEVLGNTATPCRSTRTRCCSVRAPPSCSC